jgi:hypothetical protein
MRLIRWLALVAAGAGAPAFAQLRLEAPPLVPAAIPQPQRGALDERRAGLESRKVATEQGVASLNADCSHVDSRDTPRVAQCRGRNQALQQAISAYRRDLRAFKCALAQPSIAALRAQIADTQEAIRRLGLATTTEAYEQLEDMSRDQKADLDKELAEAFLSSALSVAASGALKLGSLGTGQSERLATQADRLGFPSYVRKKILALGHVKGKPEIARNVKITIEWLRRDAELGYHGYRTGQAQTAGERLWGAAGIAITLVKEVAPEAAAELAKRAPVLAVGVAKRITVEPGLAVAPATATFIHDMRLIGYTSEAIRELDVGTEGQLKAVDRLHLRMVALVRRLKTNRATAVECQE